MPIQLFRNLFSLFLKLALWVVIVVAIIPLGIFILFLYFFPELANDAGFRFWAVFALLNVIAFILLYKPIHWIITTITGSGKGVQVTERVL